MWITILILIQWPIWLIIFLGQTLLIKKGVAIVQEADDDSDWVYEVINGFFGWKRAPITLFLFMLAAPLSTCVVLPSYIITKIVEALESLNSPSNKHKNKLVREAEESRLELKEFVKSKKE